MHAISFRSPNDKSIKVATVNMNRVVVFYLLLLPLIKAKFSENADTSNYVDDLSRTPKSDEVLWDMMDGCVNSRVESVTACLKLKVLHYFDSNRVASSRSLSENDIEKVDGLIVKRFQRYMKTHEFQIQLPEFLFQGAALVFDPKKGLTDFDVVFPKPSADEDRSVSTARDMMQQKALLPLIMMLKMKMKMMTPIMLTLLSIKATKAMVMSKLAMLLVSIFMAMQFFKKLGMHLPMLHPPAEIVPISMTTPAAYGPPPPSSYSYGSPASPSSSYGAPAPPMNSYGESNSWEPSSSSNTYSKVWDAQQIAYNAYYKPSGSSPSSSSSTSTS